MDLLKLTQNGRIPKVRDVNFFQPNDTFKIFYKGFISSLVYLLHENIGLSMELATPTSFWSHS